MLLLGVVLILAGVSLSAFGAFEVYDSGRMLFRSGRLNRECWEMLEESKAIERSYRELRREAFEALDKAVSANTTREAVQR